ncbi:class D beta-lactamase [Bacillus inaquosorum]|uniref:class D beta-lactamase n=1 Tax=Bacillus inaquosorum TaxID=483913 RepID=UPI00227FC9F6|nr:class D beta-lactamase [Bacillus inaquosorum]MCY7976266.1 class D beta-lactamase [Bacillus inaquosorum]MCY8140003.1 class D beta-lactamase [Bacillus inaquosorum]MCY8274443.1 class D beta-lactamase [Bacillus inaquosorum]MCY8729024.1 class D beta-lactamase [Bacillus inaquosorum]MCY9298041.1 class D beta-lactamase [Bacillus inaquosorum]
MKKWIYVVLVLSIAGIGGFSVHAATSAYEKHLNVSRMNVDDEFKDTDGTFILHDVQNDKTFVYNRERANKRQTPQSTFKVVNALIGLQVKAVRDEYDVKRWDGVKREFESWNRDHTLGSAMRESAIWYYQALARDIGEERMKTWLHTLSYGNEDISGGIDQFWLQSSLTISPLEQEAFLEKFFKEELPFDKSVMKTVKRMMIQEEGDHYTLYGKTGTRLTDMGLGWFVGFIKTEHGSYIFVTNVDDSGTKAKNITVDILKKHGLITS